MKQKATGVRQQELDRLRPAHETDHQGELENQHAHDRPAPKRKDVDAPRLWVDKLESWWSPKA